MTVLSIVRVVHIAIAYPSRQDVPAYRRYTDLVESLAAAVNEEYATTSWTPVQLVIQDDFARSALLRARVSSLASLLVGILLPSLSRAR